MKCYESQSHHIKVRNLREHRFSVCLYSDESWMVAAGVEAESHNEALDQFKSMIVQSSPMIGYLVYEIL